MKLTIGAEQPASLMVKKLEVRTAKSGNGFLSGEVFDAEGTYSAVIWNQELVRLEPRPGDVLEGVWKVKDFNGRAQLDVSSLYALVQADRVQDASAFVRQSAVTREVWWAYYNAKVRPLMDHPEIERLIDDMLEEAPAFFSAPAAKTMHQNWRGGLAEHTYRILHLFVGLVESGHPSIAQCCKALVVTGIVMHDFGKIAEYEQVAPGQYEIGKWGSLVGHLAGAPIELAVRIATGGYAIDDETRAHLTHVLLAHHGQVDWGSPVVPATPEALIVHMLDNLDGKLSMMDEATEGQSVRGLNTKVWSYAGRAE